MSLCFHKHTEQYRGQGGKSDDVHDETVAEADGALGEPRQNAKLPNNAMVQEDDRPWRGFNYMAMTGISHVEMLGEAFILGFVASKVSVTDVVSDSLCIRRNSVIC